METRTFEKLGITTSLLGFGAMRLPTDKNGHIDAETANAMLKTAYDAGVTYFDTAYPYHNGESEPFLGSFLAKLPRNSYQLATKLPQWLVNTKEDAKRIFEQQLIRLKQSYFDFYLIHSIDKQAFVKMVDLGVLSYLQEEQKKGRIKYLGFSFHSIYEDFEYIATFCHWDFIQIQYNYLDTEEQAGDKGYELCTSLGIPVIVMEPIKGGSLANLPPDLHAQLQDLDEEANDADYALRWVAGHPNVKVILSGMSTPLQVERNIQTFSFFAALDEQQNSALKTIGDTMRSRVGNGCTGCRYCMDCPFGVDIPLNFALWNKFRMFNSYQVVQKEWEKAKAQEKLAPSCTECGRCVPLCPQHINIPQDLAKAYAELEEARLMQ